ncbi:hypothetical protein FV232_24935 [Methylobacterium sp. WL30]|uniref:hypothetical protein n=1 Tax=unclassified Methylobacterium TaxID=2615210 RepID=UPI0011C8F392|nr:MULTISPECIES: hypothetical protein [unclassified Methylobacterium]TXN38465.1 hypothetical protein FV225_13835 [Methylobacterium sp. WL93]TXN44914.1 hypothetical protein FV227_25940 [Methylobacterium sp. WL119]TXN62661.1 hypothetical protein FV232_24935 [Methylobacterium sp. WL30]
MHAALTVLATILTASACAAAPADDGQRAEKIDGLVRIVGAQAGIVLHCRQFYAIDDTVSDGLSRTVRPTLDQSLGPKQAQTAVDDEGKRLAQEIAEVGPERWCADQRTILNTEGVRVFLD